MDGLENSHNSSTDSQKESSKQIAKLEEKIYELEKKVNNFIKFELIQMSADCF
jgi:hypothetical protein